jgi:hypothetical protein
MGAVSRVDRRSIDSMSIEHLRNELVWEMEQKFAMMEAFKELPEVAPVPALHYLNDLSTYPRDWEKGKQMQREHSIEAIPPVSECETGAGLWSIIRAALVAANLKTNSQEACSERAKIHDDNEPTPRDLRNRRASLCCSS